MSNTTRQTRANRTITVDFQNEATYGQLLGDGKAFIECVLAFLLALGLQLKHKCNGPQSSAGWPTNKGTCRPTLAANTRDVGPTIAANEPTLFANSPQTGF